MKLQPSPAEFRNNLFAAYNERLVDSLKQAISRIDPTIDWEKAEMVVDFEISHIHLESKSASVEQKIKDALLQIQRLTTKAYENQNAM